MQVPQGRILKGLLPEGKGNLQRDPDRLTRQHLTITGALAGNSWAQPSRIFYHKMSRETMDIIIPLCASTSPSYPTLASCHLFHLHMKEEERRHLFITEASKL